MELSMILATCLRPGLYFMVWKCKGMPSFSFPSSWYLPIFFGSPVEVIFEEPHLEWGTVQSLSMWRISQVLFTAFWVSGVHHVPWRALSRSIRLYEYDLSTKGWVNWSWTKAAHNGKVSLSPSRYGSKGRNRSWGGRTAPYHTKIMNQIGGVHVVVKSTLLTDERIEMANFAYQRYISDCDSGYSNCP